MGASHGVVVTGNVYATRGTPLQLDTSTNVLAYANHSTSTAIVTRYPGPRTLYWEYTNASNSADTHYVSSSEYPLPAGTLERNGDKLIVEMDVVFGSSAATKTYQCNIGYTSWDAVQGFTGGSIS